MTSKVTAVAKQSKLPTVGILDMYAKQVNEDYTSFQKLDGQATWLAIRIGAGMIMGKEALPHGSFGKWAEKNFPQIPQSTYQRFMGLAEAFRKHGELGYEPIKLLSETTNPDKPSKQAKQYVDLALDFIGEKSLTDLYIEHGIIKREVKARGGDRGNTHKKRTPEEQAAYNTELAKRMSYDSAQAFDDLCGQGMIKFLPDETVIAVHQSVSNAYHAFSTELKNRRLGKGK